MAGLDRRTMWMSEARLWPWASRPTVYKDMMQLNNRRRVLYERHENHRCCRMSMLDTQLKGCGPSRCSKTRRVVAFANQERPHQLIIHRRHPAFHRPLSPFNCAECRLTCFDIDCLLMEEHHVKSHLRALGNLSIQSPGGQN